MTLAILLDINRPAPGPQTVALTVRDGLLVTLPHDPAARWDGLLTAEERAEGLRRLNEARARAEGLSGCDR